jgi:hypothetical protein
MSWHYKSKAVKTITDLPNYEYLEGFVYKITNTLTGQIYIGKKALYSNLKKRIGVREKAATKTRKTFNRIKKESDWQKYYGSSKELLADITKHGKDNFKREILELCCSKKYLSFCEVAWQIKLDVLKTNSYNGNILGRWYSRDMENCSPKN